MNCHLRLFLCYPAAGIIALMAQPLLITQTFSLVGLGICLGFYAALLLALRGCSQLGGWAGAFYWLALASTCLNVVPTLSLFLCLEDLTSHGVGTMVSIWSLSRVGLFLSCSIAGAAIALKGGRRRQAFLQLFWSFSCFTAPVLGTFLPFGFGLGIAIYPIFACGIQGLHAMLLALALEQPAWLPPTAAEPPAIGWEAPR